MFQASDAEINGEEELKDEDDATINPTAKNTNAKLQIFTLTLKQLSDFIRESHENPLEK